MVVGPMSRGIRVIERFLRIDRTGSPETLTRARAVYGIAGVLAILQVFNAWAITYDYGHWSADASTAVFASVVMTGSALLIRWYKDFATYGLFFGTFSVIAVAGTAFSTGMGIHTALLPTICVGPMIIGYILHWRAAIWYGLVCSALLLGLYLFSMKYPMPQIGEAAGWAFSRYVQGQIALTLSTLIAMNFSYNTFSSLRRMNKSLQRTQKAEAAKSDFLATMSHELRTPLNGVIGMAEALSAADLNPREKEMAATIKRSGESLMVIIGDLLDLSKIEAGKLEMDEAPYSPRQLAEHSIEAWRAAAELKGLDIELDMQGIASLQLVGDEHRVGQILQNLLSNAVKFTTAGTVTLSVELEERRGAESIIFRVTDQGPGVPEELQEQVFRAFEQGERGTTRSFGGTGLGLPICRKLAQLMGGNIRIESSSPNGSIFRLTLPCVRSTEASKAADQTALAASDILQGARVLVAEDNEVNRMVMREFLKSWGCSAVFAHDGPSALEALDADQFDLLLLDKRMPGMSGLEVAIAIRATDAPYRTIPIIAVSADTQPREREEFLEVGMDDYVAKPIRPAVLKGVMEQILQQDRDARAELTGTTQHI